MNKFIIACLLSSLLSFSNVYAGRYEQNRDDDAQRPTPEARHDNDNKRERPARDEQPSQAQPDKKWRPALHNDPPRNNGRGDERGRDDGNVGRGERQNDRQHWRDDRNERRDAPQHRRDDRNDRQHWRDDNRNWRGDRAHTPDWRPIARHHPRHGHVVRHLPRGFVHFMLHTTDYYYYDGAFYRPHQTGYIIVDAPIGLVLTELPRPFEMFLVDGIAYYEAYGSYFVDDRAGFRVVPSPFQTIPSVPVTTNSGELFIYPARGQNQEQQSRDRYECHRWGVSQTGFDPSTAQIPNDARLPDYRRAMSVCLEARGYTVK